MTTRGRPMSIAEREFSAVAPDYYGVLIGLGATNEERAARLGVSPRTIIDYKQGKAFPSTMTLLRCPELVAAYTANIDAIKQHMQRQAA